MRRLKFTLGFATFAIHLNILLLLPSTSGYFEVQLVSAKMMDKNDTSVMDFTNLRVKKVNRTYVLTGSFDFYDNFGTTYQLVSYFYKKTGNQYIKMAYKIGPFNFCQYFDEEKIFAQDFRKVANIPPIGTCPWPKGKHTVDGYLIKLDNIPQVVSTGDYMMEYQISKDGILLNGLQYYVRLEHY